MTRSKSLARKRQLCSVCGEVTTFKDGICGHRCEQIKQLRAEKEELVSTLRASLLRMEEDEKNAEGEWGTGRSLEAIEKAGDLPKEILNARALLARIRGEK